MYYEWNTKKKKNINNITLKKMNNIDFKSH